MGGYGIHSRSPYFPFFSSRKWMGGSDLFSVFFFSTTLCIGFYVHSLLSTKSLHQISVGLSFTFDHHFSFVSKKKSEKNDNVSKIYFQHHPWIKGLILKKLSALVGDRSFHFFPSITPALNKMMCRWGTFDHSSSSAVVAVPVEKREEVRASHP